MNTKLHAIALVAIVIYWPELRLSKPERSAYHDVYDPETTTFANGEYYYRVNASNDPASVEVFKGQIDPEHLITTQYCVPL